MRALFVHTFATKLAPALRKRALQHVGRQANANPTGPCLLKIDSVRHFIFAPLCFTTV